MDGDVDALSRDELVAEASRSDPDPHRALTVADGRLSYTLE
jgi:hypothetical protein